MPLQPLEPVTLTGRAVGLEPLAEHHAAALQAAAADPAIWPFMPMDGGTPAAFAAMFAQALEAAAAGLQLPFAVRRLTDGRLCGSTRYLNIAAADDHLEIGWTWYEPALWGGPVNPECKLLLLRHAFETLGAVRVALCCDARNRRSRDAILRLGAVQEGVLRRHRLVQHGFRRDTMVFSILAEEWPAVRAGLEARLAAALPPRSGNG